MENLIEVLDEQFSDKVTIYLRIYEDEVEAKYQRFLSVEEYKDYIHKLAFLDAQLRQKLAIMNYQNNSN